MPYVRIRYEGVRRIILSTYKDSNEVLKNIESDGSFLYVESIDKYIQQTVDWNIMVAYKEAGIKIKPKKQEAINWDYSRISLEAKKSIQEAIKNSTDGNWMIVMYYHNEEKWSHTNYCCSILLPQFKEEVFLMLKKHNI